MRIPMSIYLLYHKDFKEGPQIYSDIYKLLCRNPREPFFDGVDIPVYYCAGDDKEEINEVYTNRSEKIFILLLIDQYMYRSQRWRTYIKELVKRQIENQIQIYPVSLYKYAFEFNSDLQWNQFITLSSDSILDNWEEFQTCLFDNLIRFLKQQGTKKLNIFISHSKKDKDCIGVCRAKELRDYLRSETKLSSFFDVNDIMDGFRFDKQIEGTIKESLLIVLFTNTYSSREWCRREVLTAKENRVPVIAVFLLNGTVDRIFPYIGNVPSTIYTGNWRPIINLLLRTALDQYNESLLLAEMKNEDTDIIPFPPEAYSFSILDGGKNKILYPEPPLGREELNVLERINSEVKFYTPMQYATLDVNLNDTPIAISVSEGDDIGSLGIGKEMFSDLLVELCRHILIAKGKIVYGGDLRPKGYTELFKELSYQYGQYEKSNSETIYFTNYVAWPLSLKIDLNAEDEYWHSRVHLVKVEQADECAGINSNVFLPPTNIENLYYWGCSLTKMRKEMEDVVQARILVGGRKNGFKGRMAGILEEFLIAKQKGHPIYLIGGFGGITKMLVELIEGKRTVQSFIDVANDDPEYGRLMSYYEQKRSPIDYSVLEGVSIEDLKTGLDTKEVQILFHSINIIEVVSLVLKGLKNIIN